MEITRQTMKYILIDISVGNEDILIDNFDNYESESIIQKFRQLGYQFEREVNNTPVFSNLYGPFTSFIIDGYVYVTVKAWDKILSKSVLEKMWIQP